MNDYELATTVEHIHEDDDLIAAILAALEESDTEKHPLHRDP